MTEFGHTLKKSGKLQAPQDVTEIFLLKECSDKSNIACKKLLEKKLKRPALVCAECAEISDLTVKFLLCDSEFSSQIIKLFLDICKRCKEECSQVEGEEFLVCAKECERNIQYFSTPRNKRKDMKLTYDFKNTEVDE